MPNIPTATNSRIVARDVIMRRVVDEEYIESLRQIFAENIIKASEKGEHLAVTSLTMNSTTYRKNDMEKLRLILKTDLENLGYRVIWQQYGVDILVEINW